MQKSLTSYLTFKLDNEIFAANVGKVYEILEIPKITRVPRSPDFMRGVVNLRGNVLSVIDSRTKFGLPPQEDTINTCIIVLNLVIEGSEMTIGLIVDSVKEVVDIDSSSVQKVPEIGSKYKSEFIQGMVKSGEQFIMILDVDLLFSTFEASLLQSVQVAQETIN
jgi:purine-binding chemotaxis protein CheW